MSPEELQTRSGLRRRTLYFALHCIQALEPDMVSAGVSLRDTRRRLYRLAERFRDGRWKKNLASKSARLGTAVPKVAPKAQQH